MKRRNFRKNQIVRGPGGLGLILKKYSKVRYSNVPGPYYFVGLGMCGQMAHWSEISRLTKYEAGF
jgi:hypothetical protein